MNDQSVEERVIEQYESARDRVQNYTLSLRGYTLMGCAKVMEENPSIRANARDWIGQRIEDMTNIVLSLYFVPAKYIARGIDTLIP